VFRQNKILIYGGSVFATAAVASTIIPSEEAVCFDSRLLCAPLPIHMGDLPSEDGPQPIQTINSWVIAGSTVSSVASGLDLWRSWHR
jgi:hypothetical protein